MSNKPNIYAHCPAGCNWETVHKDDFLKSVTLVKLEIQEHLEAGKTYKVVNNTTNTDYNFSIKFFYKENVPISGLMELNYTLTLPAFDTYNQHVKFRPLSFAAATGGGSITLIYELNDVRSTVTINPTYDGILSTGNSYFWVNGTNTDLFVYNEDANIVLNPESVFIKYADDINGTNMSDTPSLTKKYIGVYVGTSASTIASDYTWSRYAGTDDYNTLLNKPITKLSAEGYDNNITELLELMYFDQLEDGIYLYGDNTLILFGIGASDCAQVIKYGFITNYFVDESGAVETGQMVSDIKLNNTSIVNSNAVANLPTITMEVTLTNNTVKTYKFVAVEVI